jgi:hypothetical protein
MNGPSSDDALSAGASPLDAGDATGEAPAPAPWWGAFDLEPGQTGRWEVGPLTLWIARAAREWTVHALSSGETLVVRSSAAVPTEDRPPSAHEATPGPPSVQMTRYAAAATTGRLHVRPALPDRPVVVRPEQTVVVPPQESMRMYVSLPLWVAVETETSRRDDGARRPANGPNGRLLHEEPSHRLSDTWFGPSTREGTLCYALRTTARTDAADLPRRLHRATTPIQVENRAADPLTVERIQLPAPHLALYETDDHALWTQAIDFVHATDEGADVNVRPGVPDEAGTAARVRDPREENASGLAMSTFRALGALFGH